MSNVTRVNITDSQSSRKTFIAQKNDEHVQKSEDTQSMSVLWTGRSDVEKSHFRCHGKVFPPKQATMNFYTHAAGGNSIPPSHAITHATIHPPMQQHVASSPKAPMQAREDDWSSATLDALNERSLLPVTEPTQELTAKVPRRRRPHTDVPGRFHNHGRSVT